jgi:regulator of CtrA degradation
VSEAAQSVAFFDNTFEEALELTREARDYIAYQERADLAKMSPVGRLVASSESMRMTARLTQVVAWLLVQKAVCIGEMTRDEAGDPKYRLGGQEVCTESEPPSREPMPERLVDLLERSYQLYQRVSRLDAMFDQRPN